MRTIRYERIKEDMRTVPDGEIVTVYKEEKSSVFTITEDKPSLWAFAIKIKGEISLSDMKRDNCSEDEVKKSLKQIQFVKRYGWFSTNEEKMDDAGSLAIIFQCAYCGNRTQEVEGPCPCRGINKGPLVVSPLDSL